MQILASLLWNFKNQTAEDDKFQDQGQQAKNTTIWLSVSELQLF